MRFVKAGAVVSPHGHLVLLSTPVVVLEDASQFWWMSTRTGSPSASSASTHRSSPQIGSMPPDRRFRRPDGSRIPRRHAAGVDISLTAEEYTTNMSAQSGVTVAPAPTPVAV